MYFSFEKKKIIYSSNISKDNEKWELLIRKNYWLSFQQQKVFREYEIEYAISKYRTNRLRE